MFKYICAVTLLHTDFLDLFFYLGGRKTGNWTGRAGKEGDRNSVKLQAIQAQI